MTTDSLFTPAAEDIALLRAENDDLRRRLAETVQRLEELLEHLDDLKQRLAEGDMPL
jgi:hypothetical protein